MKLLPKNARDKEKPEVMTLNVRGVPTELVWQCRKIAAERRMTLKEMIIEVLQNVVQQKPKK